MAKPRKKDSAPEAPIVPRVCDKVTIPRVGSVLEVNYVTSDGTPSLPTITKDQCPPGDETTRNM